MPRLMVKTVGSKVVWESADKQRRIHELQLEFEGKPVKANTFSDAISKVGWEGEVETYEKEGKYGSQTFVKQPPKEDGYSGGSSSRTSTQGSRSSPYQGKDEKAIQAMWAIGQASQAITYKDADTVPKIEALAQELFAMVDRVKASENALEAAEPAVDPDQMTIEDIRGVFGEAEKAAEEVDEDPWLPT